MLVKIIRADNKIEVFSTENYIISESKEFHPIISKVIIYNDGKVIASRKRKFNFIYKHFTFKTKKVQEQLEQIEKQNTVKE